MPHTRLIRPSARTHTRTRTRKRTRKIGTDRERDYEAEIVASHISEGLIDCKNFVKGRNFSVSREKCSLNSVTNTLTDDLYDSA